MKKLILSAAFLSIGTFAMAQQESLSMQKNPAQVAQIKALQDKKMAERKANEPQMQAEKKAKKEQMKAAKDQWNAEMKQILTPEQYTKWEVKKQEKMKERKGKMHEKK